MTITAEMVKELREKTGVGMMDCKKALAHTKGNFEDAIKYLREKGLASASKKAERSANEGRIFAKVDSGKGKAVILEVNCETDFVANNEDFANLGNALADVVLANNLKTKEALESVKIEGKSFKDFLSGYILKLGENIQVNRFEVVEGKGTVGSYVHMNGKIAVLVEFSKEITDATGKDIAMQVAASNPICVRQEEVPAETVKKEREIIRTQVLNEGKPEAVVDKIVEGKLSKYFKDVCLLQQVFVKDPNKTVQQVLPSGTTVKRFIRYSLV